jgi:flagellar M-ring protein FliF
MKENLTRSFGRLTSAFTGFTAGQKVVAVVGTAALLLGGFLVFRWASTPDYSPLFSNLASADASAIIEELDAQGVPYELGNGGNTILVPREQVYTTRINLSGQGLPSASDGGYSLLDNQSLSTSEFQEQTSFKRAMEGELANTIEAIDGVDAAVVHLAMPQKAVFADEQDPTTASVLVKTGAGDTLDPEQVQAVVNLVSSSVAGLDEDKVTVTDSTGKVLSSVAGSAGSSQTQTQQVEEFQARMTTQVQTMLDRVVGPGNSVVQITPNLSFDKSVEETTRYFGNDNVALSETESSETLDGDGGTGTTGGVVGPDGQMDSTTTTGTDGDSSYEKSSRTSDNAVSKTHIVTEAAPGNVESLHVGIVLDSRAAAAADPTEVQNLVASALGIQPERNDTIQVSSMAFDRTSEEAAVKELEASAAAEKKAATMGMIRNGGLAGVAVLVALIAWWQSRRRAKARAEATEYVVEQLRRDQIERQQVQAAQLALESPAMLALESMEKDRNAEVRDEISALVERQPEDVAALLRGWLVER